MIPVRDAVKQKGCTKSAIIDAIHQGKIDAERFGNAWAIIQNQKYEEWQPMAVRQKVGREGGRARWSSVKTPKKPRKSA